MKRSQGDAKSTCGNKNSASVKFSAGMNKAFDSAANVEKMIIDPDSVDIHDVTTAMAEANMSLSLAQTVISRMVSSWNEITTTR